MFSAGSSFVEEVGAKRAILSRETNLLPARFSPERALPEKQVMTSLVDSLTQQTLPKTSRIALASVVTYNALEEFEMLKFSVEFFHGRGFQWVVRCDEKTASALAADHTVHCTVFSGQANRKWTTT